MATTTRSTIVAVYASPSAAQAAANELKKNGIDSDDIYIGSGESSARPQHDGGITGWFKRIFGQDHEDKPYYENATRRGNVVLSVEASDGNLDNAADILNRHSPIDVHRESGDSNRETTRETGGSGSVPVVNEELRVGKRSVVRGGVRIYTRTVEEPVEEKLRLREEKVYVDRQPVDRAVTDADRRTDAEQVIEMKEYAEEPVVSKQARVTEEIRVGKDTTEREQTIRDTVRRTEVDVQDLKKGDLRKGGDSSLNSDFRRDFDARYSASGGNYDEYAPAYNYGYAMAADPRYKGKRFDEAERDLRSDYGQRYPNSAWERMKDSVRYGWDKVTGKTSSAAAGAR
jgi:stress response protein YsnF